MKRDKCKILSPPKCNLPGVDSTPLPSYMGGCDCDIVLDLQSGVSAQTGGGHCILDGLKRGLQENGYSMRWLLRVLLQRGGFPSDLRIKVYR